MRVRASIKVKFLLLVILMLTLAVVSVSTLSYIRFMDVYGGQAEHNNQTLLEQIAVNLNAYLSDVYRLTLMPYYNAEVMNWLREPEPEHMAERLKKKNVIETYLGTTMAYPRRDIQRVCVIAQTMYYSDRYAANLMTYEQCVESDWYRAVRSAKQAITVLPDSEERDPCFSVVNLIRDMYNNDRVLAVVKVDANYNTIRDLCRSVAAGENGGVIILSQEDDIVYSSVSQPLMDSVLREDRDARGSGRTASQLSYLFNDVVLDSFGWRVLLVDSLDSLHAEFARVRDLIIMISLVATLTLSLLMYPLIGSFFQPLYRIVAMMKSIEQGDLSVRYVEKRQDEIAFLGAALNSMLDTLHDIYERNLKLDEEIYENQLLYREAELRLLYSQIKPHFIYNTLNMISILVQEGEGEQAVTHINQLSLLLRGIAYIDKVIPLETELDLVRSYLEIQVMRFGDTLSYEIDVSSARRNYILPPLLLQPLVENAIAHSQGRTRRSVHIRIWDQCTDEYYILCVEDNGVGISAQQLEQIRRQMLASGRGRAQPANVESLRHIGGLGIANVHERIRMHFGSEYGLRVESELDKETTVQLLLPLRSAEPGKEPYHDERSDC